jgi:hypothetical protein
LKLSCGPTTQAKTNKESRRRLLVAACANWCGALCIAARKTESGRGRGPLRSSPKVLI